VHCSRRHHVLVPSGSDRGARAPRRGVGPRPGHRRRPELLPCPRRGAAGLGPGDPQRARRAVVPDQGACRVCLHRDRGYDRHPRAAGTQPGRRVEQRPLLLGSLRSAAAASHRGRGRLRPPARAVREGALCLPAAMGALGARTTTTMPGSATTTTTPGATTTTTTVAGQPGGCHYADGVCTGSCGAGVRCGLAVGSASCECRPVSCGQADAPACNGACADPSKACVFIPLSGCECIG